MATNLTLDTNYRIRTENELALVASLMDEWTREENGAYDKRLRELHYLIHLLKLQVQRLEVDNTMYIARLRQMSAVIMDQNEVINDNLDSNPEWVPDIGFDEDNVPMLVVTELDLLAEN